MNDSEVPTPPVNSSHYETSDLYLAGFLRARGVRLTGLRRAGNKGFFIFESKDDFDRLVQEFFGNGEVGALSMKAALRDLHAILRGDIVLESRMRT